MILRTFWTWRILLALAYLILGIIYLLLMLPLFYIGPILGVGNSPWPPNGLLSNFELFWQPLCAFFYLAAAIKLSFPRLVENLSVTVLLKFPLFLSLIEAFILGSYQVIMTRLSRHFVDGIFTRNSKYPLAVAVFYVALALAAYLFVDRILRRLKL